MPAGVVLDTSFLISLADDRRANHDAAVHYWRYFLEQGIPVFLPTIVVSEFYIKQELPAEILKGCVVLPFNWDDGIKAAALDFKKAERRRESRDALKDDVKIIAQGIVKDAGWIITDDANSLYKFAARLKESGQSTMQPIKLQDGFDASFFDPKRQHKITYSDPAEEDEADSDPE